FNGFVTPPETLERPRTRRPPLDLGSRPILVFWETTRACRLACRHCRAEAIEQPLPGQLSTAEALAFVESLTGFGRPYPVLVVTGGDPLMRPDLGLVLERAGELGLPRALAPSVTPLLTPERLEWLRGLGVSTISLSLDGAGPEAHEGMRRVPGHFAATLAALRAARAAGMTVQVNTVVTRDTVAELPAVARIVADSGASIWELFFLVKVGRGVDVGELSAEENEDVCHFLYDASRYGFIVRTVEAPFFRRIVQWRRAQPALPLDPGPLYLRLGEELRRQLGPPGLDSRAQTKGTRDGKGIVFVGHNGEVYPAGFLPLSLGNVRRENVVETYRSHPLLRAIRAAAFTGRCGGCDYADLCGGSRARAFASCGDPLGEDPACCYGLEEVESPSVNGSGRHAAEGEG
ncbi:MAG: TIGR04053 family radical SAM/SPASM domain-containing protein, partial [Gaiellaceae bacterium]